MQTKSNSDRVSRHLPASISALVLTCFFFSGLTGLIYEIVWTRMIVKVIGAALGAVLGALDAGRRDGRIPATFEVVYGHAWKGEPKRTAEGHGIVRVERPGRR